MPLTLKTGKHADTTVEVTANTYAAYIRQVCLDAAAVSSRIDSDHKRVKQQSQSKSMSEDLNKPLLESHSSSRYVDNERDSSTRSPRLIIPRNASRCYGGKVAQQAEPAASSDAYQLVQLCWVALPLQHLLSLKSPMQTCKHHCCMHGLTFKLQVHLA